MKLIFLFVALFTTLGFSQDRDSVLLPEVEVNGFVPSRDAPGTKVDTRAVHQVATLAQALAGRGSLYLKDQGPGQLSTVALRGTSASQTAILWNGVNINSPTLGLSDLSIIPIYFFDNVTIQYGSNGAVYGSGAIGGTLILSNSALPFDGSPELSVYQEFGSFGRWSSGVDLKTGNKNLQVRTTAFRSELENDFPFFFKAVGYRKIQKHASVDGAGVRQLVSWQMPTAVLTGEAMITYNHRNIQPSVLNDIGREKLTDVNQRYALTYRHFFSDADLSATVAYLNNYQRYDYGIGEENSSDVFSGIVSVNQSFTDLLEVRYGINITHSAAASPYHHNASSTQFEAFTSWRMEFSPSWDFSANVRQSYFSNGAAPFTPSAGSAYKISLSKAQTVVIRASGGFGYRQPTLNDLYWSPGGNARTKPERSRQAEGGIEWLYKKKSTEVKASGTFHQSAVKDMISWREKDAGIWSPQNQQAVDITGVEVDLAVRKPLGAFFAAIEGNYAYTHSVNRKALSSSETNTVNRQMPYVPVHTWFSQGTLSRNEWAWSISAGYTGLRFSELSNDVSKSLDPYLLVNTSASYNGRSQRFKWSVIGAANNLTNRYYENFRHRAMPGRNYSLTLTLTLTKSSK